MPHMRAIKFLKAAQEFEVWWKELKDPTRESPDMMLKCVDSALISKELVTAVHGRFIQAQLIPDEKVNIAIGRRWEFGWEPGRYLEFEAPDTALQ